MGELSSEARLRGRRQWQVWVNAVIATGYPLSHDTLSIFATAYALSVTAAPCQLSQRESQGAGVARPAQGGKECESGGAAAPPHCQTGTIQYNMLVVPLSAHSADVVFPMEKQPGGAAALGSPYGRAGEPERAQAVASLSKCGDCDRVPSLPRLPPAIEPGDPNGVGQLPGSQARIASGYNPPSQS